MFLTSLVGVLSLFGAVYSFSNGPPPDACMTLLPRASSHGSPPSTGNGGFLIVTDIPLDTAQGYYNYTAGATYAGE